MLVFIFQYLTITLFLVLFLYMGMGKFLKVRVYKKVRREGLQVALKMAAVIVEIEKLK